MWSKPQPEARLSIDSKVDPVGFQDLDVSKQFEIQRVTWKTCNFKEVKPLGFWQLKYYYMFIPNLGEDEPILTHSLFNWVVFPTT